MIKRKKAQFSLEGATVSFKFIIPIMLTLGWYAYQGDMHSVKDGITEIKDNQKSATEKIWQNLSTLKDETDKKFDEIYQRRR